MFGDLQLSCGRTGGKEFSDSFGELFYVASIQLRLPLSLPLGATPSGIRVGQAFSFRMIQCVLFNQQSLSLVSPARFAEFQNYRRKH